jgi:hypothetical protein
VLRDVLLDVKPPTSIQHWPNITIALAAVATATPLTRLVMQMNTTVLVLDAIGMGVLATSSAAIAVDAGAMSPSTTSGRNGWRSRSAPSLRRRCGLRGWRSTGGCRRVRVR